MFREKKEEIISGAVVSYKDGLRVLALTKTNPPPDTDRFFFTGRVIEKNAFYEVGTETLFQRCNSAIVKIDE